MIGLLTAAGEPLLRDAIARRPLLALDFDGTLAPLVDEPDRAAMHPAAPALLLPLIERMPVAIVSGRGLEDLRGRVALPGLTLVGNHGNEWEAAADGSAQAGVDRNADHRRICRSWVQALTAPLAGMGPGIAFETKSVSLSIHYRLAPDPAAARRQLLRMIGRLDPAPTLIEGKFVLNLMAPGLVTKYEAVVELVARHRTGTAIFVGDDVTDEHVFERAPPDWLTVRVWDDEVRSAESRARTGVDRVEGVLTLLARLEVLSRGPRAASL